MLRLLALFNSRRPRARLLLSIAGIALGVALGYAVQLVNRAAVEDVAAAVRAVAGEADVEVRGGRAGFAESLYPAVAKLAGVDFVSPVLELDVGLAGRDRTLRVLGMDIFRAGVLQPALVLEERYELLAPDTVFLSAGAAAGLGLGKGDTLQLLVGQKVVPLQVAAVLPSSALRGQAALVDIATAQWRFERLGELNRLDIRLKSHASRERALAEIQGLLPPGVHASAVENLEQASAYPSRAYRVNLNVLAMVALFTGGFLVFSAQALETVRRRGEHALLRVLGLQRRGLARLVLLEAAALGVIGALAGLVLGYALAFIAVRAWGADLGARMFSGITPQLDVSPLAALGYFIGGVAVSVLGACCPRSTPRARRRRAHSRPETSRRCSRALRLHYPDWP